MFWVFIKKKYFNLEIEKDEVAPAPSPTTSQNEIKKEVPQNQSKKYSIEQLKKMFNVQKKQPNYKDDYELKLNEPVSSPILKKVFRLPTLEKILIGVKVPTQKRKRKNGKRGGKKVQKQKIKRAIRALETIWYFFWLIRKLCFFFWKYSKILKC